MYTSEHNNSFKTVKEGISIEGYRIITIYEENMTASDGLALYCISQKSLAAKKTVNSMFACLFKEESTQQHFFYQLGTKAGALPVVAFI